MNSFLESSRRIVMASAVVFAAMTALCPQRAVAQSGSAGPSEIASSSPSAPGTKKPSRVETSISVGSMAQLSATRIRDTNTNLTTEGLSPSAGVFAAFRQSLSPWLGYSVNLGYTHSTYRYTVSPPAQSTGATSKILVPAHMYEISVSYIAEKHFTNRFSAFGELGGGTVAFAANSSANLPNRSNAFRPEGIAGFGIDYRLAHGLGLRAQYRGLLIRYPYPDDGISLRMNTFISQPTLSLTYTFGKHSAR